MSSTGDLALTSGLEDETCLGYSFAVAAVDTGVGRLAAIALFVEVLGVAVSAVTCRAIADRAIPSGAVAAIAVERGVAAVKFGL